MKLSANPLKYVTDSPQVIRIFFFAVFVAYLTCFIQKLTVVRERETDRQREREGEGERDYCLGIPHSPQTQLV